MFLSAGDTCKVAATPDGGVVDPGPFTTAEQRPLPAQGPPPTGGVPKFALIITESLLDWQPITNNTIAKKHVDRME